VAGLAGAFAGGLRGEGVVLAVVVFRFLTGRFFGFAALPRPRRPFDRARLVAFREPAAFTFRRFVRLAMGLTLAKSLRESRTARNGADVGRGNPTSSADVKRDSAKA
jgi:hypothetical protein